MPQQTTTMTQNRRIFPSTQAMISSRSSVNSRNINDTKKTQAFKPLPPQHPISFCSLLKEFLQNVGKTDLIPDEAQDDDSNKNEEGLKHDNGGGDRDKEETSPSSSTQVEVDAVNKLIE